jgi:hypothetical protein
VICHDDELYEVEESEYKDPDQVDKVPVEAHFLDHEVGFTALIGSEHNVPK